RLRRDGSRSRHAYRARRRERPGQRPL
ncbi:MAG: hypothetical protein AVDCRST_MAG25-281, partial [uncultured Rubrobacteraceae bacterium]